MVTIIPENCSIPGCSHPQYDEGVCYSHYMLREAWGYAGGYLIYMNEGTEAGRAAFMKWYNGLTVQRAINIFIGYDHRLEAGYHKEVLKKFNGPSPGLE